MPPVSGATLPMAMLIAGFAWTWAFLSSPQPETAAMAAIATTPNLERIMATSGSKRRGIDRLIMRTPHGAVNLPRLRFAEMNRRGPWQQKGPAPAPAPARREPAYFTVRMYFARVLASSSATVPLGGMGMAPHTPFEPSLIFFARYASASLRDLYLAATSLYAGPTSLLSRVWQLRQAFSFSNCCASAASAAPLQSETAAANRARGFMNSPDEVKNPGAMLLDFSLLGNLSQQIFQAIDRRKAANA